MTQYYSDPKTGKLITYPERILHLDKLSKDSIEKIKEEFFINEIALTLIANDGYPITENKRRLIDELRNIHPRCRNYCDHEILLTNTTVSRTSIGERFQINQLQSVIPDFEKITDLRFFSETENEIRLQICNSKDVINKKFKDYKSIDGYSADKNLCTIQKTIDWNPFSENEDGGHQKNVRTELNSIVQACATKKRIINQYGKELKLGIFIDYRYEAKTWVKFTNKLIKLANNSPIIEYIGTTMDYARKLYYNV